jgi:hypothetical protein
MKEIQLFGVEEKAAIFIIRFVSKQALKNFALEPLYIVQEKALVLDNVKKLFIPIIVLL